MHQRSHCDNATLCKESVGPLVRTNPGVSRGVTFERPPAIKSHSDAEAKATQVTVKGAGCKAVSVILSWLSFGILFSFFGRPSGDE